MPEAKKRKRREKEECERKKARRPAQGHYIRR
jgi:hypothetical protein